jgi:hypothetical protein
MGPEVKIIAVEAENCATVIQVDFEADGKKDRMFVPTRDIFKAINNYLQRRHEHDLVNIYGFAKEDPDTPVAGLIE